MALTPLVVVLLALGAHAYKNPAHTHQFDLDEYGQKVYEFNRHSFYGLSGPEGFICMNLTTAGAVKVSLGSCNKFKYVGKFDTGIVAIKRSDIDRAMELSRNGEGCLKHSLGLRLHTSYYESFGRFNFFKCYEQITRTKPSRETPTIVESSEFKIIPTTWTDRYQDIPFQTADGDVVHQRFQMRAMMDTAAIDTSSTVCFNLTGASRVMLTLSRCRNSADFRIYVTDDKVTGLDLEDTDRIASLLHHKCPGEKKMHAWHLSIDTKEEDLTSGSLAVYSCTTHSENNRMKYSSNGKLMGLDKYLFFSLHHSSSAFYSADLKGMIDYATSAKSDGMKVHVEIDATAPVSIVIGRCMNRTTSRFDHHLVIADWVASDVFELSYEDLMIIETLSLEKKCDDQDSDEALYFIVSTKEKESEGKARFSLSHQEGKEESFETIKSSVMFTARKESTVVKSLALERVFDEILQNGHMMAIELNTTSNVNIYVSKCRYSTRQTLALNAGSGMHQIRHNHRISFFRLWEGPNCVGQDGDSYSLGYLHIEGLENDAKGVVRFVTLNNGTKLTTKKFVKMEGNRMASPTTNEVIATFKNSNASNEFDLRYFAEVIRSEPRMSLYVEHTFPSDITVTFTKCLISAREDTYSLILPNKYRLTNEEVEELRYIMKSKRCDNDSLYGLFATTQKSKLNGELAFTFGKYGRKLRRNEYIKKNEISQNY